MLKAHSKKKWLSVVLCLMLLVSSAISLVPGMAIAADTKPSSPYVNDGDGEIGVAITPVKPPDIKMAAVSVPDVHISGALNSLSNVPAFDWSYGCSATSASMLFGYYDRHGYGNFYTGPANGGVCPLDNSVWGELITGTSECPINASHQGVDGRTTTGHADDYWFSYGSSTDPYYGNWAEHTPPDCAGDFMGTNQYKTYNNTDGSTTFWSFTNGTPFGLHDGVNDFATYLTPSQRDGAQGLAMFAEYSGYTVESCYNQRIQGGSKYNYALGFTFDQYMAEIDAGNPVFIQVEGHTMLGYGYSAATQTIYMHDTWDYLDHSMTWGGSYSGMYQWGVVVLHLAPPPGNYGYYQIWWLDSATDAGDNPIMENFGTQSGSVPVENGDTVLWKSNAAASGDVVFDAGTWTVNLNTDNLTGDYTVQIGESEGGSGFTAFGDSPETGTFNSPLTLYITLPSVTVPDGHYLALRVSNTGTGSVITSGYTSYLGSPQSVPSYPLPELVSGILAGLGLTGLAAFIIIKRRKARALTEA